MYQMSYFPVRAAHRGGRIIASNKLSHSWVHTRILSVIVRQNFFDQKVTYLSKFDSSMEGRKLIKVISHVSNPLYAGKQTAMFRKKLAAYVDGLHTLRRLPIPSRQRAQRIQDNQHINRFLRQCSGHRW